ncbi:MAG: glycosyltransferase [Clostridia bacterium]|nr:glycosyltransferase [Clostridia bacterium]
MKILLLADHMENGGAETHIYELSRFLFQKGHSVTILSYGGKIADLLAAQGIRTVPYGKAPLITLWHILREQKPDIVHAHTRQSAFLCRLLLTAIPFPFVFTAHAHFAPDPIKDMLSFFPKHIIAVSPDIAKHLAQHFHIEPNQISVIENGINNDAFCPKRDSNHCFNIVTVSRLDPDCSLTASLLCQLAPTLSREIPELCITIVGGGRAFNRIQKLAAKANTVCGRAVVRAVGQKQNVIPYLQSASLFIGVSRAALEAMSCGIPVILSGNEGYLGLAFGNTLALAEEGNFCARGHSKPTLKRLKRDILSLFSDVSLVLRASQDGRRQVLRYHTAEQMGEKTLQVYHRVLCDRQKARASDILLCGYYGYGNLGDELSLAAISSHLLAKAAQIKQKSQSACSAMLYPDPRLSVLVPSGRTYAGLDCVDRFDPCAVIQAIRGTGVLVLGGGSLLQNKTSTRSLLYYLTLLKIAHLLGTPTMLYGAGIGPIRGKLQLALCKSVLRNVDQISVRDKASHAFLKLLGITEKTRLSSDPVLFCHTAPTKGKGYLLAFVRTEEARHFEAFFNNTKKPILLAAMDKSKDLPAARRLANKLRKHGKCVGVYQGSSARELRRLIGGAELVVSARLHALILAFCMGVPFVGLSDDPKITAFSKEAYRGCPRPVARETLARHFQRRCEEMKALAAEDDAYALSLSGWENLLDKE